MKRGDIWIGIILLIAAASFALPRFIGGGEAVAAAYAEIEVNGEHYDTVALTGESREIEIRTERGFNRLRITDGGIEMVEADCPDQLCIGFGHVHELFDKIVCLPNRIFVEVIGGPAGGGEPDAVVQ